MPSMAAAVTWLVMFCWRICCNLEYNCVGSNAGYNNFSASFTYLLTMHDYQKAPEYKIYICSKWTIQVSDFSFQSPLYNDSLERPPPPLLKELLHRCHRSSMWFPYLLATEMTYLSVNKLPAPRLSRIYR